ncbi:MAG: SRPBCC family protein [Bdellovibrio sp.]|nr:SRPBCC family protein [Bdellovibrio sp.]
MNINPKLDLVLEHTLDITPEQAWRGWTTPGILTKWFCPEPWKTIEAEIDLRPGGKFKTVMQSPEGDKFPNMGCFLEVVPNKKLIWTDCLLPDFRPVAQLESGAGLHFTATIMFEPIAGGKTKYTAIAMHRDEADRKKHEDMGFHQGWSICADQLEKVMKGK